MDHYMTKAVTHLKKFIERFVPPDKSVTDLLENSPDELHLTVPNLTSANLISPSQSTSEGTLAQFIPARDVTIGFKSASAPSKPFIEFINQGNFQEALALAQKNTEIMEQALFEACIGNNNLLVRTLLDKHKFNDCCVDVNKKNGYGKTALHLACAEGFFDVCESLLQFAEGIDVDAVDYDKRTALHFACIFNEDKIAHLLVRYGANLNPLDFQGNSPLHFAVANAGRTLVEWLVSMNADTTVKNNEGLSPLAMKESMFKQGNNDEESDEYSPKTPHSMNYTVMIEEINNFFIKPYCGLRLTPKDFKPIGLLGKGSFGEVYLVQKNDTNERFAMKILAKNKIIAQHLVRYAITERNVMSTIKHPFIVSLRYSFQTASKLYLIQDYCAGGTLKNYLKEDKKFTEEKCKIYLCEILLAIEELHRNNVIYRDLKPENVGIDKDGHVLLIDFGLSKESVMNKNSAHSFCGSVGYLAPEMLKRTGHGKAVDWYLLGVILYEMLTGLVPHYSKDNQKMFQDILYKPLKTPNGISKPCADLLHKLLEKNPDFRFGSEKDAEDIKAHPFFADIDWDAVLRRELIPPSPMLRTFSEEVPFSTILDEDPEIHPSIQGWTFVGDSD